MELESIPSSISIQRFISMNWTSKRIENTTFPKIDRDSIFLLPPSLSLFINENGRVLESAIVSWPGEIRRRLILAITFSNQRKWWGKRKKRRKNGGHVVYNPLGARADRNRSTQLSVPVLFAGNPKRTRRSIGAAAIPIVRAVNALVPTYTQTFSLASLPSLPLYIATIRERIFEASPRTFSLFSFFIDQPWWKRFFFFFFFRVIHRPSVK